MKMTENESKNKMYKDKARKYLYPGLERTYKQDEKMIAILARAFEKIDILAEDGRI